MDNEILYKSIKKESEVYICLDYYIREHIGRLL